MRLGLASLHSILTVVLIAGLAAAPVLASPGAGGKATPVQTQIHTVREGDTLWALSRRHGTTPERLASLNGIPIEATLQIGQRLKVPSLRGGASGSVGARAGSAGGSSSLKAPVKAVESPTAVAAMRTRLAALPSRGANWTPTLLAISKRHLGVRYRWGGTGPAGFDCSGFLYHVYRRMGVELPRTTYAMYKAGVPVPRADLKAGDIVFFQTLRPGPSHAGIYLGDGQFIHSSSGFGRVTITPMNYRYYAPRYLGARRF